MVRFHVTDVTNWFTAVAFAEPMVRNLVQLAVLAALSPLSAGWQCTAASPPVESARLPDLPGEFGVAGPFAGIAGNALVVAGGTNFPDAAPWNNGTKTWHDAAFVLPSPDAQWLDGYKLPRPLAYGVSVTTDEGLLCIGGCDEASDVADVFLLQWDGESLTHRPFPPLPASTSCAAGVLIGSRVYVAGGQAGPVPTSGRSNSHFWMLDLGEETIHWESLPTWPGPERFYAVAGTDGKSFFLFSGIRRIRNEQGEPALEYLSDAYRFDLSTERWARLADLPHANAAVASPAPFVNGGLLLLGRGADGIGIDLPLRERPPFGREMLRYNVSTRRWESWGALPFGIVAVPSAQWHEHTIIASGESRPGVRSSAVWSVNLLSTNKDGRPASP